MLSILVRRVNEDSKRGVLAAVSFFTYFVMLIGAMLILAGGPKLIFATSDNLRLCIGWAFLFPCGLAALAGPGSKVFGLALLLISYASFIAILVAFMRARSWRTYVMLCICFAVLLMLNISGCRKVHEGLSGITMAPKSRQQARGGALNRESVDAKWWGNLTMREGMGCELQPFRSSLKCLHRTRLAMIALDGKDRPQLAVPLWGIPRTMPLLLP